MKSISQSIIGIITILPLLVSCNSKSDPQPSPSSPELQKAMFHQSEQLQRELQHRDQLEHQLTVIQQRSVALEQSKSHWQSLAMLLGIGSVVALFTGAILGSGAKSHEQQ